MRDKISTPTGMGDVAHSRGSNIDDLGFTCTRYSFVVRSLGEPAQKSRSKPCSRAVSFSSWLSIYSCCGLVTMALRFGYRSSGSSSSRAVSPVLVFTVSRASKPETLGSWRKLHLFFVLELVLPIRAFLMTIARDERIMLELRAQAVWQFPTFSRKEVQPVVHVSRSLSDQTSPCGSFPGRPRFPAHHRYPSFECLLPTGA